MTQLHLVVSHRLPVAEALKRIKALLKDLKTGNSLRQNWKQEIGFISFKERATVLQGVIVVSDDSVVMAGDLPWTEVILRRKAKSVLRRAVRKTT